MALGEDTAFGQSTDLPAWLSQWPVSLSQEHQGNCATFAGTRTAGVAGALVASLGVITPSLTLTLLAAMFLAKFRESRIMNEALYGIRPICIGMIAAVIIQQCQSNYAGSLLGFVSWQAVVIGAVSLLMLLKCKWSVPLTIVLAAGLGILLGMF